MGGERRCPLSLSLSPLPLSISKYQLANQTVIKYIFLLFIPGFNVLSDFLRINGKSDSASVKTINPRQSWLSLVEINKEEL